MSAITTHVLDVARGRPAVGLQVVLEHSAGGERWTRIGAGETDHDGRARTLMPTGAPLLPGIYRLVFQTHRYFDALGIRTLYPHVVVTFETEPAEGDYHVPLLLSPFGYTTYRGT